MSPPDGPVLVLRLTYAGGAFAGWQVQPGARTVQAEVERALGVVLRRPVRVVGAGRTDAGVHADDQWAALPLQPEDGAPDLRRLLRALNGVFARDVAVTQLRVHPAGFHPRFSATSKLYRYRLHVDPVRPVLDAHRRLHVTTPFDADAARAAAAALTGRHDFAVFEAAGAAPAQTVRDLYGATMSVAGPLAAIDFSAPGFLRKQVRAMVGAVVQAAGSDGPALIERLFAEQNPALIRTVAPAHGLTLAGVRYDDAPPPLDVYPPRVPGFAGEPPLRWVLQPPAPHERRGR